MDIRFSKDSGSSEQEVHGEKKNQNALLVLLLVLVCGFTYIYFFTNLIKPQETPKPAELSVPAPQVVKIPLPARDEAPVGAEVKTPAKAETPKAAATAPATPAAPVAKPSVPAKPVPAATAAPAPANIKEKTDKAVATKMADKKPAVAVKKNTKAKVPTAIKEKKPSTAPWSVLVGNYVLEEALTADMGRVRKAGFKPTIKPAARKRKIMSRLFVSEHSDRVAAQSAIEKLNRYTSDSFVLEHGGMYSVYAGSYLQKEAANSEKLRLKAAGITVTVKYANIGIPTQSLSVGPFKNKKEAETALGRLKSAGIKATLAQK